ncbi:MAG TPA: DUF1214 domain-containing protein [Streptosporangiaceae bacterium]|nr:DUF1214 domain-containing protein [Streptosporangiaceae bacterium]
MAGLLTAAAADANAGLVADLFQFRNIGLPLPGHWRRNGARFGTDYLTRTAIGRSNIFVNTPEETTYFYQDLDSHGERLDGSRSYSVTFPPNRLPPVRGFWSLTLYNEHHFFHPNELNRYSLGTKNPDLHHAADGSLTLTASAAPPEDADLRSNWLPAPAGPFSLFMRAYWPEERLSGDRHSWILKQPEDIAVGVGDGGHQPTATDVARRLLHGGTCSGHFGQLRLDVRHVPVGHR